MSDINKKLVKFINRSNSTSLAEKSRLGEVYAEIRIHL